MSKPQNRIKETVLKNRFKKKHISPAKVDKANCHCNLIQLLVWWDESSVVYKNKQFSLKDEKNCIIYSDMIYNHYTGEALNPLNALMAYFDLSFPQAYYVLNHFLLKISKLEMENYIDEAYITPVVCSGCKSIDLNYILNADQLVSSFSEVKTAALRRVYAYLGNTRCIDRDIISHFIKHRYIALDAANNICFLTYKGNDVIAITKKGTNQRYAFKQNMVRETHTGFFYAKKSATDYRNIYVFESCVDLMSFLTLSKSGFVPMPEPNSCYIALNGANIKYLDKMLNRFPDIAKIHLCLDNDPTGRHAAQSVSYNHREAFQVDNMVQYLERGADGSTPVKDWNELLVKSKH